MESRLICALRAAVAALFFAAFGVGGFLIGMMFLASGIWNTILARGRSGRDRAARWRRRCVRAAYRLFVRAADFTRLFMVEVSHDDRMALAGASGCVVVASHPSLIDVVVLMSLLGDSTAVAKSAAGRNPFYSRVVSSTFIVNDDPMRVISEASALLSAGVNIVVFPDGTRTPPGAKGRRLRRGAAQIAIHAAAPVLCATIECDPPVLAKGQPWWDVGGRVVRYRIRVSGKISPPPLPPDGSSHSAAKALTESMGEMI